MNVGERQQVDMHTVLELIVRDRQARLAEVSAVLADWSSAD